MTNKMNDFLKSNLSRFYQKKDTGKYSLIKGNASNLCTYTVNKINNIFTDVPIFLINKLLIEQYDFPKNNTFRHTIKLCNNINNIKHSSSFIYQLLSYQNKGLKRIYYKGQYYYGNQGIILDNCFNIIFLNTFDVYFNDKDTKIYNPIIYIHPIVLKDNRYIYKLIKTQLISYYQDKLVFYKYNNTLDDSIDGDIIKIIIKNPVNFLILT